VVVPAVEVLLLVLLLPQVCLLGRRFLPPEDALHPELPLLAQVVALLWRLLLALVVAARLLVLAVDLLLALVHEWAVRLLLVLKVEAPELLLLVLAVLLEQPHLDLVVLPLLVPIRGWPMDSM